MSALKKVAVIGHFGEGINLLNGQTVKTKIITEELQNQLGQEQVLKFDTHGGWKTLLKAPFQILRALQKSSNVLIFPAHNGLRVYAPLLSFLRCFFKNRKIHYVVIGGWLPKFILERKSLAKSLKRFDGIYVETKTMKCALEAQGFTNVFVMPNCKNLDVLDESDLILTRTEPHHVCTFSRVMREKGIQEAVEAVALINRKYGRPLFVLDIFGQIEIGQKIWFEELEKKFSDCINYKGIVPFDQSVETLRHYDALLFPTYYEGEGFAGTVIDAFASGVPIIASDWRYNSELIKPYTNGLLVKCKDVDDLVSGLRYLHENVEIWNKMKVECLKESKYYLPENAIKILVDRIGNEEKK